MNVRSICMQSVIRCAVSHVPSRGRYLLSSGRAKLDWANNNTHKPPCHSYLPPIHSVISLCFWGLVRGNFKGFLVNWFLQPLGVRTRSALSEKSLQVCYREVGVGGINHGSILLGLLWTGGTKNNYLHPTCRSGTYRASSPAKYFTEFPI